MSTHLPPDSHFHLHLSGYRPGNDSANDMPRGITCAVSPEDWEETLKLAEHLDNSVENTVVTYLGIHPWYTGSADSKALELLEELLVNNPRCGVGEIGLDKVKTEVPMETQEHWFREQMEIASRLKRPVSVHCVKAWGALTEVLRNVSFTLPHLYIHAFGGSKEIMKELTELGCLISFSPFTIGPKRKHGAECLKLCPGGALLLDTDFPYTEGQAISEYPQLIDTLYRDAAEIRQTTPDRLADLIETNLQPFLAFMKHSGKQTSHE